MFLMNSSQREDQVSKLYRDKIVKDVFKVALMVIGLKVACAVFNKDQ